MTVTTLQPVDDPVEPPVKIQKWAELHVDDQVFRLIPPWNLDKLAAQLEAAIADRTVVKVRAYTELNGETTILVNPSRAAVVYLAKRPELVGRSGMPD
ncbi:MAG TPA: hypothetical protein VGX25_04445 [Actinophytocola sp.]|uniref:hypothetical protein n=1 Tax=Actinophytocola sp. TaxID=1872138 RepID=UPI002DDC9988|nr:hypothetical protein [Actinophytocola sp.]HEV2778630.1 hypothetical protein [Actinophytocola sp.]